ncbi:cytochrome c [Herbaspirillum sp. AP02]|uniref:cytochrome c n=1 Tax=unclassified Herbaspirillum TaxID=2624150 RepID=UPI0015D9653F|nr:MULTISPECIES: cytochrome c [unclassified Herbaspirillum]MBG7620124.1 cytochrome c [Herbaspirillum sp. AP02]NZD69376.1 cytochrome c [Herbaspirillum sp. AP21]
MKRLILTSSLALGAAMLAAAAAYNLAYADDSLTVPAPPQPPMGGRLLNRETAPLQAFTVPPADAALSQRIARQGSPSADDQLLLRGAYLARAGDCVACHTSKGGAPFAGGLALASPLGAIYSTNITPDKEHGIGDWSYEDFARLMRTGVTRAGYTVYPAMPYPSYSRLSEEDMQALYAYFTKAVTPSAQANRANDIPWPLSMRWPLAIWRKLFAPTPAPYVAPPAATAGSDQELARGAYLVEGLGHCGSCHTPRSTTLQEKSLRDDSSRLYLSGGQVVDGWNVPSLRNEHGGGIAGWSQADLVEFLRTGRNQFTASFGAMNDVVEHSMQYLTEADLNAISRYLLRLSPRNDAAPYRYDEVSATAAYEGRPQTPGAALYLDRCAACHRSNGTGYGKAFPALAGNPVLQTQDAGSAIRIILQGGRQPATDSVKGGLVMAPYAQLLNDQQVAEVTSYIQTAWGNRGATVSAADVAKIRKTAKPVEERAP